MTLVGTPGISVIPADYWLNDSFLSVSLTAGAVAFLNCYVYKRDVLGNETLLFTNTSAQLTDTADEIVEQLIYSASGDTGYALNITDRLVFKFTVTETAGHNATVKLYFNGDATYTHMHGPVPEYMPLGLSQYNQCARFLGGGYSVSPTTPTLTFNEGYLGAVNPQLSTTGASVCIGYAADWTQLTGFNWSYAGVSVIPGFLGMTALTAVRLDHNSLSVASVNTVLQQLVANGAIDGTVNVSGQTPSAAPTGAGATAVTTLQAQGWTVTTD